MKTLDYNYNPVMKNGEFTEVELCGRDVGLQRMLQKVAGTYCPFANAMCNRDCLCYMEEEQSSAIIAYCYHPFHAIGEGRRYTEIAIEFYTPEEKMLIVY